MILSITSTTPRNLPRQGLLLLCHGSGEINAGNSRHFLFVLMSRGLFFFRWDVSVICIIAILEITVTLFISLCFWPNRLEFFRSKISVCDRKKKPARERVECRQQKLFKSTKPSIRGADFLQDGQVNEFSCHCWLSPQYFKHTSFPFLPSPGKDENEVFFNIYQTGLGANDVLTVCGTNNMRSFCKEINF